VNRAATLRVTARGYLRHRWTFAAATTAAFSLAIGLALASPACAAPVSATASEPVTLTAPTTVLLQPGGTAIVAIVSYRCTHPRKMALSGSLTQQATDGTVLSGSSQGLRQTATCDGQTHSDSLAFIPYGGPFLETLANPWHAGAAVLTLDLSYSLSTVGPSVDHIVTRPVTARLTPIRNSAMKATARIVAKGAAAAVQVSVPCQKQYFWYLIGVDTLGQLESSAYTNAGGHTPCVNGRSTRSILLPATTAPWRPGPAFLTGLGSPTVITTLTLDAS
jgi:hypothetical protein